MNTNDIINNNLGSVNIGPTGQTAGTGPNLNVNGIINVTGLGGFSINDLINITATNPLNIPTVQTSANGTYYYVEFTGVDMYTFTLNPLITTFNYILVGPGGKGSNNSAGGGGGGYVQGTSIPNNSSSFGVVIGPGSNADQPPTYNSRLSVNSTVVSTANSGLNAISSTGGAGGTTLVTIGYGTGTTGPNGSANQGGQAGGINFSFGGTTKNYIAGGAGYQGGLTPGGGGGPSGFGVAGQSGVLLVYFPLVNNVVSTISITPKYIQFPDGTQQTTAPGYQSYVTATLPVIGGTYTNLVSATIPAAGVWLVEGSFQGTITNPSATIYILSLSTTTAVDFSRAISRTISIQTNYTWYDHITSVFVLTASTTIHFFGILFNGSSSATSNTIRYTQIG